MGLSEGLWAVKESVLVVAFLPLVMPGFGEDDEDDEDDGDGGSPQDPTSPDVRTCP